MCAISRTCLQSTCALCYRPNGTSWIHKIQAQSTSIQKTHTPPPRVHPTYALDTAAEQTRGKKFKLNKLSPVLFEFLKFILCMYPENIQKLHKYFLDINTIDSLHDSLPELRCVKLNN